ncbi:MAG: hypothetical protein ACXVE4_09810 [Solirubrobacteraceae bacterium]
MRRGPPAAVALAVLALVCTSCGTAARSSAPALSCNGSAALCSRPLNEVIFPGTHNSFAASSQPGWYFASQTYPIPRQLDDGIRALLIDIHYGVYDPVVGRVRTDLTAEGSDRNKVVKQVPPPALQVADRVAGGVGLGNLKGKAKPFLCHTLCELGADPLDRELKAVASFLADHPGQVLIVIVEDYVPPSTIEHAFVAAGLTRYVATLKAGAPLPTLGKLVTSGHRLLVFAEVKGGTPSWYMPAFSFIQDTPLGAVHPGQLSCARYRGEPSSPMLLLNHWIPPFPPSPTLNAQIGRAPVLRAAIRRCTREREIVGAIVAVDFYERTAVAEVAEQLNARR